MDQYMRLRKYIQSKKGRKEFGSRLAKLDSNNKHEYLGKLLLDAAKLNNENFKVYLHELKKSGVNVNFQENKGIEGKDQRTALMVLSQNASSSEVSQLLQFQEIDPSIEDNRGDNALFYALRNDDQQQSFKVISQIILKFPKLVDSVSSEGKTLLVQALQRKSLRIVEFLLKNNANPNIRCQFTGNTALNHSLLLFKNFPDIIKNIVLLLLNFHADPEIQNKQGQCAFDLAKKVGFQLQRILSLIENDGKNMEQIKQTNACQNQITSMTMDENSYESSESDSSEEQEYVTFYQQIKLYEIQCKNQIYQAWKDIQAFYNQLYLLGQSKRLRIGIIGSYAYGLWTSTSDIDISFTNQVNEPINIQKVLGEIHQEVKSWKKFGIYSNYLNIGQGILFPNLKIQLDRHHRNRKLDITIFQKKNNGLKYVNFVKQKIYYFPVIQSIFFVLKRLLLTFNLHNPSKGGIKTYGLFLMIWNYIKQIGNMSEDQAFMQLIFYYAHCYIYQKYEKKENQEQIILQLNIRDPLNYSNNVGGKKTDVQTLRKMFKSVDYALRMVDHEILPYLFSLHKMFNS